MNLQIIYITLSAVSYLQQKKSVLPFPTKLCITFKILITFWGHSRYRPFLKTLPRSITFVNWISVRFYETCCIINLKKKAEKMKLEVGIEKKDNWLKEEKIHFRIYTLRRRRGKVGRSR